MTFHAIKRRLINTRGGARLIPKGANAGLKRNKPKVVSRPTNDWWQILSQSNKEQENCYE